MLITGVYDGVQDDNTREKKKHGKKTTTGKKGKRERDKERMKSKSMDKVIEARKKNKKTRLSMIQAA